MLNVGAGAGSYEPSDRQVTAVEPSASMRAQRPPLLPEAVRYPSMDRVSRALGGVVEVRPVPIPLDCADGFNEAYYGRPEMLLDPAARRVCSAWSFVAAAAAKRFETDLARDLADRSWDARHGALRTQPSFEGALVLIVG